MDETEKCYVLQVLIGGTWWTQSVATWPATSEGLGEAEAKAEASSYGARVRLMIPAPEEDRP